MPFSRREFEGTGRKDPSYPVIDFLKTNHEHAFSFGELSTALEGTAVTISTQTDQQSQATA